MGEVKIRVTQPEDLSGKPWEHHSRYGTHFECERCDFRSPMIVTHRPDDDDKFASDVAEMISMHHIGVWPNLFAGFAGYDCIKWDIRPTKKGES